MLRCLLVLQCVMCSKKLTGLVDHANQLSKAGALFIPVYLDLVS